MRTRLIAFYLTLTAGVAIAQAPISIDPNLSDSLPGLNVSQLAFPPANLVFVRQDTGLQDTSKTVQIQRVSTDDDGHTNPHALSVLYRVNPGGDPASMPWAISGTMVSATGQTGVEAGTAVSGVAQKLVKNRGILFGGHFQVKDQTGGATLGGIIGAEINIQANGADVNENRYGLDIIAKTFGTGSAGHMSAGLRIRDSGNARWANGIDLNGSFENAAIAIPAGQRIALGNGVSLRFDPAKNAVVIERNGVVKHNFPMD